MAGTSTKVPISSPSAPHRKKIVIIGAGISGLSCAVQLKKLNYQNVILLEARSRIGGRMHTEIHADEALEFGAQWIHGEVGNPIYELAVENDLVDLQAPDYMNALSQFPNFEDPKRAMYRNAFSLLLQFLNTEETSSQSNMESHLQNIFKNKVLPLLDLNSTGFNENGFYDFFSNLQGELIGCKNLNHVSVKLLNEYIELPGLPTVQPKSGYKPIINFLSNLIPSHWILQDKNVVNIDWSAECHDCKIRNNENLETPNDNLGHIKITCKDGSKFFADHVVITVSIGCLKMNSSFLFSPPLPVTKTTAIESIGFDTVNKIYLEFESQFWNATDVFPVIFEDLEAMMKIEGKRSWYTYINRFAYVPNQPRMLCAWITGTGAEQMESLSIEEAASECLKLLKTILNKQELPNLICAKRSRWHSDEYSRGSYSYPTIQCEKLDVTAVELSEPIFTNLHGYKHLSLLFAGEATHLHYFGTVHGAYETGIREANRINLFYK